MVGKSAADDLFYCEAEKKKKSFLAGTKKKAESLLSVKKTKKSRADLQKFKWGLGSKKHNFFVRKAAYNDETCIGDYRSKMDGADSPEPAC